MPQTLIKQGKVRISADFRFGGEGGIRTLEKEAKKPLFKRFLGFREYFRVNF
jgi:hypothetical protein